MEEYKFGDTPLDELYHHGIKGMKWGVRRFQNKDGSLTTAGKKRRRNPHEGDEDYWQIESQKISKSYREKRWAYQAKILKKYPTKEAMMAHKDEIFKKYKSLEDEERQAKDALKKSLFPLPPVNERKNAIDYFRQKARDRAAEFGFEDDDDAFKTQRALSDRYIKSIGKKEWDGDGTELWYSMADNLKGEDKKLFDRLDKYYDSPDYNTYVWSLEKDDNNPIVAYRALREYEDRDKLDHSALGESFVSEHLTASLDELYHHGVKGMKWGVRRFQNKDGSLTVAGRARQRLQEAAANRKAKKAEEAENERVRKLMSKPIRKLSAAELAERTTRAEQERRLRDVERQSNEMAKNAASFAKKLGGKLLNEAAVPALVSAGKSVLNKKFEGILTEKLGLKGVDDGVGELKKQVEKLNLQKQLKDLTRDNSLQEEVSRLNLEKQKRDLTKNDPLKDKVDRLELEKRYKDLTKDNSLKEEVDKLLLESRRKKLLEDLS